MMQKWCIYILSKSNTSFFIVWNDVCVHTVPVPIYLHISTQRLEYPLHTPFPFLMTSSDEQIFGEIPRYPSKSYSTQTNVLDNLHEEVHS